MELWGLTGGIASGKSTVAQMFRDLGVPVLDADSTYHQLLKPLAQGPSPLALAIEATFPGALHLAPDPLAGTLRRAWLAQRIFSDPQAKQTLELLTHPIIQAEMAQQTSLFQQQGCPCLLHDIPLLFEQQAQDRFVGTILVWLPQDLQRQRLAQRSSLKEQDITAWLRQQMPIHAKRSLATYIIDNSLDLPHTAQQVHFIWQRLGSPKWSPPVAPTP